MAGNVARQAGEQSSRLITKCTWHQDKIVSWWLWGVYQRAERMNIQRLQPRKGESVTKHATIKRKAQRKNILRFKSWRVWFESASLGLCATGSGLTTTSTTDTRFIFSSCWAASTSNQFYLCGTFHTWRQHKGIYRRHRQKKHKNINKKNRERNAEDKKTNGL